MKNKELYLLTIILLAAFTVRLYRFSSPLADWHSWRQVDTSSVSRSFVEKGFDLLHPTYHDLSNVPSGTESLPGKDNPNGYRFVEFPLYNFFQAGLFSLFGGFTLEEWGRLVSIAASLVAIVFLYLLTSSYYGTTVALFASFFFALLPFNVYFHRTILPDTSMTMAILGGIYFFHCFAKKRRSWQLIVSMIFTASALLFKPYALFFSLPIFFIAYHSFGHIMFFEPRLVVFFIGSITPLIIWRLWMRQFPEGIPYSDWLFNRGNIRFKPSFFYWIFAERIGKIILGYFGAAFLLPGLIASFSKKWLAWSFLISSLFYVFVIASGNVQHDYYQILIMPTIALFLGLGIKWIIDKGGSTIKGYIFCAIFVAFSFLFSWFTVREFYRVDEQMIAAAKTVDRLLPKNAKIVVSRDGDTTFLYYTKRQGWSSMQDPLPVLKEKGATHFIIVFPKEADYKISETYPIFYKSDIMIIFSLRNI